MISPEMRGAWRELERKLRPFVERRVSGPGADDVLQDVFLRMQRGLAGLREEERFGPWVYQVARSAILDHRRRTARRCARATATRHARPWIAICAPVRNR